jgi:DNA-binding protein Fis
LPTVREAEDLLIEEALRRTDGNQTMAAELLGITRQTLIRHLKKAGKRD